MGAIDTLNIHGILSQVRKLDKDERFILLERLISLVRKDDDTEKVSTLSSISGIGSEIWKNVDVDEYIEQERKW